MPIANFDFQGHRGCRGLLPENTVGAFLHAQTLGVTTMEMDVVITRDLKVVVSHEPFLNHEICTGKAGEEITKWNERDFNIYHMSFARLSQYDCGIKKHIRFPSQQNSVALKPLLSEIFEAVEAHRVKNNLPYSQFNIEIKSSIENEEIFHPPFQQYTELLVEVCEKYNVIDRLTIQSFDVRPLRYTHQYYPFIPLSLLVENDLSLEENLNDLGFVPSVYSPEYASVDEEMVRLCNENNMRLIPWTVNELEDMKRLINIGVHGLISDYPDKFLLL